MKRLWERSPDLVTVAYIMVISTPLVLAVLAWLPKGGNCG